MGGGGFAGCEGLCCGSENSAGNDAVGGGVGGGVGGDCGGTGRLATPGGGGKAVRPGVAPWGVSGAPGGL